MSICVVPRCIAVRRPRGKPRCIGFNGWRVLPSKDVTQKKIIARRKRWMKVLNIPEFVDDSVLHRICPLHFWPKYLPLPSDLLSLPRSYQVFLFCQHPYMHNLHKIIIQITIIKAIQTSSNISLVICCFAKNIGKGCSQFIFYRTETLCQMYQS